MVVSIENLENQSLTSLRKTILFNISSKRKNQNEKTFEEESIEILKILIDSNISHNEFVLTSNVPK